MIHPDITLKNCDCIDGLRELDSGSIDCTVTSIPFGALFSYSHKPEDIGNNQDGTEFIDSQFGLHFRFFLEELYRSMAPGAVFCCHIQQLLRWKVQHGYMGMRDFRGAIISMAMAHGFQAHGEVAIVKNPQSVAQRLNLHSLMFVTAAKDSSKLAPAMNDYVLFLKKPGDRKPVKALIDTKDMWLVEPSPIIEYVRDGEIKRVKANWQTTPYNVYAYRQNGQRYEKEVTGGKHINPDGWITKNDWVKYAHGAWTDIHEIDTLDGWRCARETNEEKHVCPLQLEVIRRCLKLYSAPGDLVLDPFMGIGSTAYVAYEQDRHCIGFELKESYHQMSLRNIEKAKKATPQLNIFDGADSLSA